jgi:hypothetical protein
MTSQASNTELKIGPKTDSLQHKRWLRLSLIIVVNALLQVLLVLPSPWGTDSVAVIAGVGSLIVFVGVGVLAIRTIRQGDPSSTLLKSIANHPWRFIFAVLGTLIIAALCWLIALLCVAFLPGSLAIFIAWIAMGALACLPIYWFIKLRRMAVFH